MANLRKNYKKNRFSKESILPNFINKLVRWLGNCLLKVSNSELTYALSVADKILSIAKTRGKTQAIDYSKALRRKFLTHILSMNEEFYSKDQLKFPKFFKPIIKHITNSKSYPFIRLIFSVLVISRYFRLEASPSFISITQPPGYTGLPSDLSEDMVRFLKELGVNTKHGLGKPPKSLRFKEYHMTSKSGPNGHALWTSFIDYMALSESQKKAIGIIAGDKLIDLATRFYNLYCKIPFFFDVHRARKGTSETRKLTVIQDKEGKSREVAILDYWSQGALLPLHNYLSKQLARIPQDCTRDQMSWFKWLKVSDMNSYHSVDLTTATDRFPISIQKQLLTVWFGREYAEHWEYLMVGTPFTYKGEKITYKTGNPMGAYSSFTSFAICHHFFVYLACKRAKKNWKKCKYMILGDDIVIAHDDVAMEYKKLLTEWDIPFNKDKTITSRFGFEFAKQVRLHNVNISPFPLSALIDRRSESFTGLSIIVNEIWYKNWNVDIIPALKDYYIKVLGWPRPKWRVTEPKIRLVISLLSFLQGRGSLGTAIKEYVTNWAGKEYATLSDMDFSTYASVLSLQVVHKTFLESMARITNKNDLRPLGQLATDMVISITSLRDGGMDCFDLIESVPFLQIYGRAEETYLNFDTRVSVYQISESPKVFRDSFGKVDIPLSDEAFYVRHRDILLHQSLRAANLIISMIKSVPELDFPRIDVKINFPWKDLIRNPKKLEFPEV